MVDRRGLCDRDNNFSNPLVPCNNPVLSTGMPKLSSTSPSPKSDVFGTSAAEISSIKHVAVARGCPGVTDGRLPCLSNADDADFSRIMILARTPWLQSTVQCRASHQAGKVLSTVRQPEAEGLRKPHYCHARLLVCDNVLRWNQIVPPSSLSCSNTPAKTASCASAKDILSPSLCTLNRP